MRSNWNPGNVVYRAAVVITLGLLLVGLFVPRLEARVGLIVTTVLVLATVTYAWLTFQLIEEMKEARRQAATPAIRAGNGGGNMDSYSFPIENVGNTPAINAEIAIGVLSGGQRRTVKRAGLITPGQTVPLAIGIGPEVFHQDNDIHIVATYNNLFGERFESVTVFPKAPGSRLPSDPEKHTVRRFD